MFVDLMLVEMIDLVDYLYLDLILFINLEDVLQYPLFFF